MSIENVINRIPVKDITGIVDSYSSMPHEGLPKTNMDFLYKVVDQIYNDIMRETDNSTVGIITQKLLKEGRSLHNKYALDIILQESFKEYLDVQTHKYIINIFGADKWNGQEGRFEGMLGDEYQQYRGDVIKAFVKHAIKFFQEEPTRSKENKVGLRADLLPYLNRI